jgi:hypothetical protein
MACPPFTMRVGSRRLKLSENRADRLGSVLTYRCPTPPAFTATGWAVKITFLLIVKQPRR